MRPLVIAACLVLAACATRAEKRAIDLRDAGWACADMGYQPETLEHRACTERMFAQLQANRTSREVQASQNAAAAGAAILLAPPPQPTVTSCRWFAGNYVCQ